jgi:hypothetical protein
MEKGVADEVGKRRKAGVRKGRKRWGKRPGGVERRKVVGDLKKMGSR